MQAELDRDHSEMILKMHNFGRLGCAIDNRPYVVPISYVYEDGYIYGHTNDGQKLRMMRQNPNVCFEVDEVTDHRRWKSVICHGQFEELQGTDMANALDLMIERLTPISDEPNGNDSSPHDDVIHQIRLHALKGATYRIRIDEISGRFERP